MEFDLVVIGTGMAAGAATRVRYKTIIAEESGDILGAHLLGPGAKRPSISSCWRSATASRPTT